MFRPPYTWNWKTIIPNLAGCWWDLVGGLQSLWRWLPVIWFDRDWDWTYLAILLEVKCSKFANCLEKGYHENGEINAAQLREVARLLERVHEHDYLEEASDEITSRTWWEDIPEFPGHARFHCEHFRQDGSQMSDEEYMKLATRAEETRNHELSVAMRIIAAHLFEWWD